MDIIYLKYFADMARLNSISKAAEENHIAQPAMSRILSRLEKEYETPLFERIGRNIKLNADGQILYDAVRESLAILEDAKEKIAGIKSETEGTVKICIKGPFDHFSNLCSAFEELYPNVHINIYIPPEPPADISYWEYDLAFLIDAVPKRTSLNAQVLMQRRLVAGVNRKNPVSRREAISLQDLAFYDLILPDTVRVREIVLNRCESLGFIPSVRGVCDNRSEHVMLMRSDPMKRMAVMLDNMATAWPENYKFIPIEDASAAVDFYIVWNREVEMKPVARVFFDYCVEYYRQNWY
mgnify:FL=1